MKVVIPLRVDAYDKPGGDVVHAEKIMASLTKLGVEVAMTTDLKPDLSGVDLVHLFNMDWVRDPLMQARHAYRYQVPIVLTPIHHSFREIDGFERQERYGLRRLTNIVLRSYEQRETAKNIYRAFVELDRRKWWGTLGLLKQGLTAQYQELLSLATVVMPNTYLEEAELEREFGVEMETVVVPAGVDPNFLNATADWLNHNYPEVLARLGSDFVAMVGRIEPRKNQLRVIEALAVAKIPLLLVGDFNPHHFEYSWRVQQALLKNKQTVHLESIPHQHIGSVYASCKVHLLASWFETTGLVNLEAALAGATVVSTNKGFGKEYLAQQAILVDPARSESILCGVEKGLREGRNDKLQAHILQNYTWDIVGEQTLAVYQKVLKK